MNKINKYTPVFCLWLAVILLFAHQIIPHDHHIASPYADLDKNCHESENKSDHHTGFPVHCNVFNDLVAEKSRSFNVSPNLAFNIIALICKAAPDTFQTQIRGEIIFTTQESIIDSAIFELHPLRAPPSLA